MKHFALLLTVCGVAAIFVPLFGVKRIGIVVLVAACSLYPATFYSFTTSFSGIIHVGVASDSPAITSYIGISLLLFAGTLLTSPARTMQAALGLLPWLAWLSFCVAIVWGASPPIVSAYLQFLAGAGAFIVARLWLREDEGRIVTFACAFSVAAVIQFLYSLAGELGLSGNAISVAAGVVGRAQGSFDHPDTLAKAVVLPIPILLIALKQTQAKRIRLLLFLGVFGSVGALLLSESRTGLAALFLILGAPLLFRPGAVRSRTKSGALASLGVVAIVALGATSTLGRFESDPLGGSRLVLDKVGWGAFLNHPIIGVGINRIVEVLGRDNALIASGVPVHNAFLLVGIEQGGLGLILLIVPLALVMRRAFRSRRQSDMKGLAARYLIGFSGALVLLGLSDWGLVSESILVLTMTVLGALLGFFERPVVPEPTQVPHVVSEILADAG